MADQLNEDSDNTHQNQSLGRQQTASTHDQIGRQPPHEDVIQGTLLRKYCRVCEDNKCKLDGYKVETLLHIPLAIRYYRKPGEEDTKINSRFECNLHEFNVWRYLMNSPRQCSKLSTTFSNNQSVSILPSYMLAINASVNGKEQAKKITEQVLKYVFNKLGQILDVEEVSVLDGNIKDSVKKLNEMFDIEVAHASKIGKRIFIVYPHSGKECVDKCLREYKDDSRQVIVTQTFCLDRVVKRFPTEINHCLSNPSISYTVESVDNESVYTLSGPESLVNSAIRKLSLVKENLKHYDVKHLTRSKTNGLRYLNVEDGINAHLETKFSNIVFEQNTTNLCVYGLESNMLSDAANFVEQLIDERVQRIEGKSGNQTDSIINHLQSKFEGKILVDADKDARLYLFGLRPNVDEACYELLEIQEGIRSMGSSTHDRYDPRSLFAEQCSIEEAIASVKVVPSTSDIKADHATRKSVLLAPRVETYNHPRHTAQEGASVEITFGGLPNPPRKNICFANSLLQSMKTTDVKEILKCHEQCETLCFICELKLFYEKYPSLSTLRICHKMEGLWPAYRVGNHEDVHEMFQLLMTEIDSMTELRHMYRHTFEGELESSVTCGHCEAVSTKLEIFNHFTFSIKNAITLEQSIYNFFAEELIEEYKCESCSKCGTSTKKFRIRKLPANLVVHLKRFAVVNDRRKKDYRNVQLDEDIHLKSYVKDDLKEVIEHKGKLTAAVIHDGLMASGHYFCLARAGLEWYRIDDTKVRKVKMTNEMLGDAYLLIYKMLPRPYID